MNESIHKPSSTGSNSSDTTCHTEDHDFQDMEKAYKGQNDDASTATEHVPLEMQAVQVNLNDPDMDLLEKTVRRIIPIPKAFYFETGNNEIPLKTKAWHRTVSSLQSVLRWSEKIGEGVAKVTGITDSRFDHVTLNMTPQQWEEAEKNRDMQLQRRKEYLESLANPHMDQEIPSKDAGNN